MTNEIVNFMYAALSSSVGSSIYEGLKNILSPSQFDDLDIRYKEDNIQEFEIYSLQLLKNQLLKQEIILLKNKSIFVDAEIKASGKLSKVDISIDSNEKDISIGKEIKIEAKDGGKVNFKYKNT